MFWSCKMSEVPDVINRLSCSKAVDEVNVSSVLILDLSLEKGERSFLFSP